MKLMKLEKRKKERKGGKNREKIELCLAWDFFFSFSVLEYYISIYISLSFF